MFRNELEFEQVLIERLTHKGWSDKILKYKNEDELIQNWANILFQNNQQRDRLNDVPLSKTEMEQIMEIVKRENTPFNLHSFINGKSVTIKRDNPLDLEHLGKEVSLTIYNRDEIAGGKSSYQIAEQPIFKKKVQEGQDRRGDFMLLINGMPVIHVELKKDNVPVSQAINQIIKYTHEGVFTGLFSLVQIFVAMTPQETLYFANPGRDGKFIKEYMFHWEDFNNEVMNNWEDIAENLLSIPMAHMMIGYYTVADSSDKTLKVLRSYQYNAASAICGKVHKAFKNWPDDFDIKGGYIWHTTGSGKTLTSFKTAQLIANSNDADKVLFLLDRVDLGVQSLDDYRHFSNDDEDVQGTDSSSTLLEKMNSDDSKNTLIVTSIQKMDVLARKAKNHEFDLNKINNKKVVIVIDECHRDTFGDMMANIKEQFCKALYFGFTGTPINIENSKKGSTTPDVFGPELHRYTISDGIRDGNVLGFDVEGINTFDPYDIRKDIALQESKAQTEAEALNDNQKSIIYLDFMRNRKMEDTFDSDGNLIRGVESYIPKTQYTEPTQKHKKAVVEDILSKFLMNSFNRKFHSILATSSIDEAIEYYRLFKDYSNNEKYPNLNVTAIFDPTIDNNDDCVYKEDGLIEILHDYNDKFSRVYSIATAAGFKKEVCLRLAHKEPYIGIGDNKNQQIDIVIVVDQLLTGFDSKWINTLYLDKIIKNEQIIQAFSRTNRLFNRVEKPHGIIKMYRKPYTMKASTYKALEMYSGNQMPGIFVDKLELNLNKANTKFMEIKNLFISVGVNDFSTIDNFDNIEKAKFSKEFNIFNQLVCTCRVQGMTWSDTEFTFEDENGKRIVERNFTENNYYSLLQRYKELPKRSIKKNEDSPLDIDPAIISIPTDSIDSEFMQSRFDKWIKVLTSGENDEKTLNDLHASFSSLSQEEQKVAKIIIDDIHNGILTVEDGKTFRDYIDLYNYNIKNKQIEDLSNFTGIPLNDLSEFIRIVDKENPDEYGRLENIKKIANKALLKQNLENKLGIHLNPGKVQIKLDTLLRDFIESGGFDIDNHDC